jgi:hypothetical protein
MKSEMLHPCPIAYNCAFHGLFASFLNCRGCGRETSKHIFFCCLPRHVGTKRAYLLQYFSSSQTSSYKVLMGNPDSVDASWNHGRCSKISSCTRTALISVLDDLGRPAAIIVMDVLWTLSISAPYSDIVVSLRHHRKSLYQWTIYYDRGKHVLPLKPNRTANFLSEPRFWWICHCTSLFALKSIRLTRSWAVCCMLPLILKNEMRD